MTRDEVRALPRYTSIGGYPLVYYTRDGLLICAACAERETDASQEVIGADVHWEGPALVCDDGSADNGACQGEIASAYGERAGDESDEGEAE